MKQANSPGRKINNSNPSLLKNNGNCTQKYGEFISSYEDLNNLQTNKKSTALRKNITPAYPQPLANSSTHKIQKATHKYTIDLASKDTATTGRKPIRNADEGNRANHQKNVQNDKSKEKKIKENFASKANRKQSSHARSQMLSTDRLRKNLGVVSPSRKLKNSSAEGFQKKMLKTTQQTFGNGMSSTLSHLSTRAKKQKKSNQNQHKDAQPEEYLSLDDHFLQLNHEEAHLLSQKLTTQSQLNRLHPNLFINNLSKINLHESSPEKSYEEPSDFEDYLAEIITIQRWWRKLCHKKQEKLSPIIFEDAATSLPQPTIGQEVQGKDDVETQTLRFASLQSKQTECQFNPLELRQQLAAQQLKIRRQLLDKLLKSGKIDEQSYFERNYLISEQYQVELRKVNEIKQLLSENTRQVHIMAQKLKEDCQKIENASGEISQSLINDLFKQPPPRQQCVTQLEGLSSSPIDAEHSFLRQKSLGCHSSSKDQANTSFYKKNEGTEEEEYEFDFEHEDLKEGATPIDLGEPNDHNYNTNFSQMLADLKEEQEVAMEIDQRTAIQMGMAIDEGALSSTERIGMDTSLNGMHAFLLTFFKFYLCYYKDEFLRLINMPYGYSVDQRIKLLQGYEEDSMYPDEDEDGVIYGLEHVISDDIFDEYYERVHHSKSDPSSTARRANIQFEKMHNRCVFQCFNVALNQFRPYFEINGTPYPWINSEKALTFYCIAEENIQEVFEKSQFRVLREASTLCGIIVEKYTNPCEAGSLPSNFEDALEVYNNSVHPTLFKAREERFNKDLKMQIAEVTRQEWRSYEDHLTLLQFENEQFVFSTIIEELVLELLAGGLLSGRSESVETK